MQYCKVKIIIINFLKINKTYLKLKKNKDLMSSTSECGWIWRQSLLKGNEVKIGSLAWDLTQSEGCLYEKRRLGRRHTHRGKDHMQTHGERLQHQERPQISTDLLIPGSWTSSFHNCEGTTMLSKLPSMWYFVTTALAHEYSHQLTSNPFDPEANSK